MMKKYTARKDVYSRVTDKIIADLEQGVRPWMKPWNAEHLKPVFCQLATLI